MLNIHNTNIVTTTSNIKTITIDTKSIVGIENVAKQCEHYSEYKCEYCGNLNVTYKLINIYTWKHNIKNRGEIYVIGLG